MSPPSAVCFDLDDTLLEYNQDPDDVLDAAHAAAGVGRFCSPDELRSMATDVGNVRDDHEFLTRLFRLAADRYGGPTESAETLARTYENAIDHSDVSFRPGAEAALELAREHGPVGLITNGSRRTQTQKFDALGLHDAFETTVYAGEETAPKPARDPFDRALLDLGVRPQETLYVGNSMHHDVAGAKGAGLQAAWYPGRRDHGSEPGEHAPDYTFETLAELASVLS
ncbi:HAD family hydrolase [Halorarius litoreus]|uniref:HAD family hydrolase n=1 Tax=Halorarius litoreus TaxID=2962676 RepID=UPI0020CD78B1|nr:HAD family hydrolase [Halorarius litoreus]